MRKLVGSFVIALIGLASAAAFGQNWPARPVRIIIGYGAGGSTDVIVRLVADDLGKRLGQPFIVENRTGANGSIAGAKCLAHDIEHAEQ